MGSVWRQNNGYFQKDNTTAHTANATVVTTWVVFEDRIISRGPWPPRSPDISFCNFYLWGKLKGKVYKNNPHSIEALQNEITCVTGSITVDQLQKVSHNLLMQCKECFMFASRRGPLSAPVIKHSKFVLSYKCVCTETDVRESATRLHSR
jgi:hypothetical protein